MIGNRTNGEEIMYQLQGHMIVMLFLTRFTQRPGCIQ